MSEQHIAMLLSNPLAPDPRVEREARSLSEAGYPVTVFGWDRKREHPERENRDGIGIHRIGVKSGFNRRLLQLVTIPRFWMTALRQLNQGDFALVHCHDLDTLLPGVIWAKRHRRPVIFDAHEAYPKMIAPFFPNWFTWCIEKFEHILLQKADAVITVGKRIANIYRPICNRTLIVGNYPILPDLYELSSRTPELRQELGIPPHTLVLGYVGRLHAGRLLTPLVDAITSEKDVHLIIGGRGPQEEQLQERTRQMSNLHFIGFVDPDDLLGTLFSFDATYYGLKAENPNNEYSVPNALFNTLAVGRPILCTDMGEIADIVRQEQCGIVSASTPEAMREAMGQLRSSTKREEMGLRARIAAERRYNWGIARSKLLDLYKALLNQKE